MRFQTSIEANHPDHVAGVLALLWRGRAMPYPTDASGSWAAFAGGEADPMVAIHRRNRRHRLSGASAPITLSVPRTSAEVFAIALRENWPAEARDSAEGTIALWVEGRHPIELKTQARRLGTGLERRAA